MLYFSASQICGLKTHNNVPDIPEIPEMGYDSSEESTVKKEESENSSSTVLCSHIRALISALRMLESRLRTFRRLMRDLEFVDSLPLSESDKEWKKSEIQGDINRYQSMNIEKQISQYLKELNSYGVQVEE